MAWDIALNVSPIFILFVLFLLKNAYLTFTTIFLEQLLEALEKNIPKDEIDVFIKQQKVSMFKKTIKQLWKQIVFYIVAFSFYVYQIYRIKSGNPPGEIFFYGLWVVLFITSIALIHLFLQYKEIKNKDN